MSIYRRGKLLFDNEYNKETKETNVTRITFSNVIVGGILFSIDNNNTNTKPTSLDNNTFFDLLPPEITFNIMNRCVNATTKANSISVNNFFTLLNAYPHLESHLCYFLKKWQNNQLIFLRTNSLDYLKYVGKLQSHTLNCVTIELITIDMCSFSAALKNVKKMELLNVTLTPIRECVYGVNKCKNCKNPKMLCEFMCEEVYILDSVPYHRKTTDFPSTLTDFVFANFTKVKKLTLLESRNDNDRNKETLSKIITESRFPNLESVYLYSFDI